MNSSATIEDIIDKIQILSIVPRLDPRISAQKILTFRHCENSSLRGVSEANDEAISFKA